MTQNNSKKAADGDGHQPSVLIVMSGLSAGSQLAQGLSALGADTAVVSDQAPQPGQSGSAFTYCDFSCKKQINEAINTAIQGRPAPDLIVICVMPEAAVIASPVETQSEAAWHSACLAGLKTTLHCLQGCHGILANGAGIVLIGPNFSFTGAAGLVALSTLAEGQRALAKSAARQWGAMGVRVNWMGLAPDQLCAALRQADLPQVPELGPPPLPLGSGADWQGGVASTLMFLAGAGGKSITGMSLNLDGGEWMVP